MNPKSVVIPGKCYYVSYASDYIYGYKEDTWHVFKIELAQ